MIKMIKKKNNENEINGGSFLKVMSIFLVICSVGFVGMILSVNALMREHDKELTSQICGLVAEKMNSSIRYMTVSVQDMAGFISARQYEDLDQLYSDMDEMPSGGFISMGFVDSYGTVYGSDDEQNEFRKWSFLLTAKKAAPVSITFPYRSSLSGQPVITMFSRFTYGGTRRGWLYMTYPLQEIQNLAQMKNASDGTEIWLMNAKSDNTIQCAGKNQFAIGSWANALVSFKKSIDEEYQDDYLEWKASMNSGNEMDSVNYTIDDTQYTQVFSQIDYMDGWYVVVRSPSSAMSSTMGQFRTIVLLFTWFILSATLIMSIVTHRRDVADRKILENLSIHDPITQVMNRRAFDLAAENYLNKGIKSDCSLLFIDVDFFKQVNDQYGHDSGDKVLVEFAAAIKEFFGEDSIISRYGGDEFLVMVKHGDRHKVDEQLDKLRQRVHAIEPLNRPEDDTFRISFSCGGASSPSDSRNFDELKTCADRALYLVKKKGRDGYKWYDPDEV